MQHFRHLACFVFVTLLVILVFKPANAAEALDDVIKPGTKPEVLGTGYGFCEGPAADAQGNVYFSDGKKDNIHYYQAGKPVTVFAGNTLDANGMMFNTQGELVVCQGAAFKVVAFDVKTKKSRVLCDKVDGGRFNEPNDVTVDRQGGFYFTDPNYRHRKQETVRKEDAYYCSAGGKVTRVSTACAKPNGILLTADDKTLYLADYRKGLIYKYDVQGPGKLANETKWLDLGAGPDGMTLDQEGNLYVCCNRGGILIYDAKGKKIGKIDVTASNACFGGPDFKTLYVTAHDKFLGIPTKVTGVKPLPLRTKTGKPAQTSLVYEIVAEPGDAFNVTQMKQLIGAIDVRINPRSTLISRIVRSGHRVRKLDNRRIEIIVSGNKPGEVARIERLLRQSGTLEFRILANKKDHGGLIARALAKDSKTLRDPQGKLLASWVPVEAGREREFKDYRDIATRKTKRDGRETLEILVVKDDLDVTGAYLTSVKFMLDHRGAPCVGFTLNALGAHRFRQLTGNNLPDKVQEGFTRKLGIILNEKLYSAPAIQSTISHTGEITGSFTKEEVQELVDVLNSGALPIRIKRVEATKLPQK